MTELGKLFQIFTTHAEKNVLLNHNEMHGSEVYNYCI